MQSEIIINIFTLILLIEMNFRIQVKEICKQKNITQKELATQLGITDIGLNQSLRGKYPQLQTLERIDSALNVPITELFEKQEQPQQQESNVM